IHLPCSSRWYRRQLCCSSLRLLITARILLYISMASAQEAQQSREPAVAVRLPRQQAEISAALDGIVRSDTVAGAQLPVPGVTVHLQNLASQAITESIANGEGVFRIFPL